MSPRNQHSYHKLRNKFCLQRNYKSVLWWVIMELEDAIFLEDDMDLLDIIEFGFPKRRFEKANYFQDMDNLSFFRRFRLTKPTVLSILEEIETDIEFENDL